MMLSHLPAMHRCLLSLLLLLLLPLLCVAPCIAFPANQHHHTHRFQDDDEEALLLSGLQRSFLSHEVVVSPLRDAIDEQEDNENDHDEKDIEWNTVLRENSHGDDKAAIGGRPILSMRIMHRDSHFSPLNKEKKKKNKESEADVFAERLKRDVERVKQIYARMERNVAMEAGKKQKIEKHEEEQEVVVGTRSYEAKKHKRRSERKSSRGDSKPEVGTSSYPRQDGKPDVPTSSYPKQDSKPDMGTSSYPKRDSKPDVCMPSYPRPAGLRTTNVGTNSYLQNDTRDRHRHPTNSSSYSAETVTAGGFFSSPLTSGLSQGSGEYFTRVAIGTPPKHVFLVIDTGSDLMWLQCAPCEDCYSQTDPIFDPSTSRTFRYLPCTSPICSLLELHECEVSTNLCLYQVVYGDGSFTEGEFGLDSLTFQGASIRNVALGCGNDNEGLFTGAAGLFGLGAGSLSFISQLTTTPSRYPKIFSYCLLDRDAVGLSTLTFGGFPHPSGGQFAFTSLLVNQDYPTFYYVPLTGISVGGVLLTSIPMSAFHMDTIPGPNNGGGVIIDSGTSVSRLTNDAYTPLRDAFRATMHKLPFSGSFSLFDTCYDLSRHRSVKVPTISLHFEGGATMSLPPTNYFVPIDTRGTYCLAFSATLGLLSIIGNIQQQGFRIVFDIQSRRLGFAPHQC